MQKKLTITLDEEVYQGLRDVIGPGKISRFVEKLVRPHVIKPQLESAYEALAKDEAREAEAIEFCEVLIGDFGDSTNETW